MSQRQRLGKEKLNKNPIKNKRGDTLKDRAGNLIDATIEELPVDRLGNVDTDQLEGDELENHLEREQALRTTRDNQVRDDACLFVLGAYARLCYLERLRWVDANENRSDDRARFMPLDPEMHAEYARLRNWWNEMGADKQETIKMIAKECAAEIEVYARYF